MPLRCDAAHRARSDHHLGELRADRCDGDRLTGRDVGGGGCDGQRFFAADVDLCDQQAVGVGVAFECGDASDYDAGNRRPPLDGVDRKAEHGQAIGDRGVIGRQRDELAQPAYRNSHSCSRKSGSLVMKRRMSSTW